MSHAPTTDQIIDCLIARIETTDDATEYEACSEALRVLEDYRDGEQRRRRLLTTTMLTIAMRQDREDKTA